MFWEWQEWTSAAAAMDGGKHTQLVCDRGCMAVRLYAWIAYPRHLHIAEW